MAWPIAHCHPRAVMVAESPAADWSGDPRHLLAGPCFRRLAERVLWPGHPRAWVLYLTTFLRCNVVSRVLPPGGSWPSVEAREGASEILRATRGLLPLVLLGRRAADAFRLPASQPIPGAWKSGIILPHPSGRCRMWNDPEVVDASREAFATLGFGEEP